jgi:hypothetical protein
MDQQQTSGQSILPGARPQNARHSEKPGSYQLAVRSAKAEVNPGDITELEIYLTCYGEIQGAKILFHPPPYFIDTRWSIVSYDANLSAEGEFTFGATDNSFDETGGILILNGGLRNERWSSPSLVFDVTDKPQESAGVHIIASEKKFGKPLLQYRLQTHKDSPPGTHRLNFYLSYFNGQEWKSDGKSIDLKVPNWFERNQGLSLAIAAVSLLITVGGGLVSLLRWLLDAIS